MNSFTRQFAILMPNGELFSHPGPAPEQVEDYSIPSPLRDQGGYGFFSMFGLTDPSLSQKRPAKTGPVIFDTEDAARQKLDSMRAEAAAVGVSNYGGEVVHRLCTPFTAGNAALQFLQDVQSWLQQHSESES